MAAAATAVLGTPSFATTTLSAPSLKRRQRSQLRRRGSSLAPRASAQQNENGGVTEHAPTRRSALIAAAAAAVAAAPLTDLLGLQRNQALAAARSASVELIPTKGSDVKGTVRFTEITTKYGKPLVQVDVNISGLSPGKHGFHIHEIGNVTCDDGLCTGGHFNPDKLPHGAPTATRKFGASASHFVGEGVIYWRHAGDLGNIDADSNGVVKSTFTDPVIKLTGANSIVGHSVVPTGNAGGRAAYGTIV
eukprot:jgi/Chlat1/5144/Chrsp33S05140